mgnify:FL=1
MDTNIDSYWNVPGMEFNISGNSSTPAGDLDNYTYHCFANCDEYIGHIGT